MQDVDYLKRSKYVERKKKKDEANSYGLAAKTCVTIFVSFDMDDNKRFRVCKLGNPINP